MAHQDSAALEVLTGILARAGTGRLDRALIDARKALSVGASVYQLHDPGVVTLSATLSDEQSLDEVKAIMVETLATLGREGPAPDEVERARTRILQGMDRTFANSQQLAMQLTEVVGSGDWRLLFTNYEQLKRVTAAGLSSDAAWERATAAGFDYGRGSRARDARRA